MNTSFDCIVIGAGQAGLSASYNLQKHGLSHLVIARHGPGWAWREQRWDSFCLVTPNWQCKLPDFPYSGSDPQGFMGKDAVAAYVRAFADFVKPPLKQGVTVHKVQRNEHGLFVLQTSDGTFTARSVIVAIGANHRPITIPMISEKLPQSVDQFHAMSYRNPESLRQGDVLIIGTGQSGSQIAEDCHLAGRRVHLSVGSAPRSPRRYRGRDVVDWLDELGHYDLTINEHPLGKKAAAKTNHYVTGRGGGHEIDLRKFYLEGMGLFGHLEGYENDCLIFGDDLGENLNQADASAFKIRSMIDQYIDQQHITAPKEPDYIPPWEPKSNHPRSLSIANIGSIIWCMGFRPDFGFIAHSIFDERGYPKHDRGMTEETGLAFLGLPGNTPGDLDALPLSVKTLNIS